MMHVVVPQALIDRGSPVRLVVSGGGSGGHTFPAVTVIRAARVALGGYGLALDPFWVGSEGGIEKGIAEAENVPFTAIPTGKLRRARNPLAMLTAANIKDAGKVPAYVGEAISVVRNLRPDAVLCTGGYVSVPVGLAARFCHRPLLVHEQTVRVGLANRITMRGATRIALSAEPSLELLPERLRGRAVVTGNPLRPGLGDGDAGEAPKRLGWTGWTPSLPTVYVTGARSAPGRSTSWSPRSCPTCCGTPTSSTRRAASWPTPRSRWPSGCPPTCVPGTWCAASSVRSSPTCSPSPTWSSRGAAAARSASSPRSGSRRCSSR